MAQHINTGSLGKTYEDVEAGGVCGFSGCEKELPVENLGGVCWNHATAIYTQVSLAMSNSVRRFDPEYRHGPRWIVLPDEFVYYVQLNDYVKIGTTTNIHARMSTFRVTNPDLKLLAIEPGGRRLERQRHEQFAEHRIGRTECFKPHPELGEHIDALRKLGHRPKHGRLV